MATQADVRRIALSFAGAKETPGRFAFEVLNKGKMKGFVWVWMERVNPKKPRVANPGVIAVRVASLVDKDLILASDSKKYFTEPHYAGFPAVLVRLDAVTVADLEPLIADAWQCMAPAEPAGAPKTSRKAPAAKRPTVKLSKSTRGRRG
ncbi:MAG: MmcQ/YjbR family DNA-binding protein [Gemmatimonadaceae bacterium]